MLKIIPYLEKHLNNISLKRKMIILYVFFMLMPLILTDGILFYNFFKVGREQKMQDLRSDAEAVRYGFKDCFNYPVNIIRSIYKNEAIEDLLNTKYEDPFDYIDRYMNFKDNSLYDSLLLNVNDNISIYADNDTILNGGMFYKLETVKDQTWYKKLSDSEGIVLMFVFDKDTTEAFSERKVLLVRKLEMARFGRCEKALKMELNYRNIQDLILNDSINSDVYICQEDRLLMTNVGGTHYKETYTLFDESIKYDYKFNMDLYNDTYTVYLRSREKLWVLSYKSVIIIVLLILLNIILPSFMIKIFESSITERILRLDKVFEEAESDKMTNIDDIQGSDEISFLMKSYNVMAERMNGLIQNAYINKLREQETDIARQNAELLALHSQINPHFLFNALESIRMHSLIKKENETAEMVEYLAMMQRGYVDWNSDVISIEEEMKFIHAYLELQKYRFGDRLSYHISVSPECSDIKIPRLSIVTFVENACVHGIEKKTEPGWIFVSVYPEDEKTVIQIEDTGRGLDDEARENIRFKMENASLDLIKAGKSIGITNACLRLKMMTEMRVSFDIESTLGEGTTVTIICEDNIC